MSITLADCLRLPSLSAAQVVAGSAGLDSQVVSVSVLEYADPDALSSNYFRNNELVISALISIKDNVADQCKTIRLLQEMGEVGIVLYYVGHFMPDIDPRLIATADEIGFPIICMPKHNINLRYSEVICEVMEAIFKDRMKHTYFVGEIIERMSALLPRRRTMDSALRMLSDRLRCTLFLTDRAFNLLSEAYWSQESEYDRELALNFYKNNSKKRDSRELQPVKSKRDTLLACLRTIRVETSKTLYLILLTRQEDLTANYCDQAAEVVQLFINIWSKGEGNEGTAELVRAIINDEPLKMRRLAEILNVCVADIHAMWLFVANREMHREALEALNLRLMSMARSFFAGHQKLYILDVFEEKVVAFLDSSPYTEDSKSAAQLFVEELAAAGIDVSIVFCTNLQSTTDVRNAYTSIVENYHCAGIVYPKKQVFTLHEFKFAGTCVAIIRSGEAAIQKALAPIACLTDDESGQHDELLTTLAAFLLDTDASYKDAAELLFIHKNTVKYRVGKINEKMGFAVTKMPENYNLYTALAVSRLLTSLQPIE